MRGTGAAEEELDLLELELDRACATAAPPAGAEELEAADQRAAEDRDSVGPALLDIAADGVAAAQALRQASDVLERHGYYRDRFPAPMKASFDSRSGELRAAMEQLGGTLLWLTRPEREADLE